MSNPNDTMRLAKAVDEGGDAALEYVKKMVGKFPATKFDWDCAPDQFYQHAWPDHAAHWKGLGTTSSDELKKVTQEVTQKGRKVIYKHGDEDHFGFYEEARNIFVAAKEDG